MNFDPQYFVALAQQVCAERDRLHQTLSVSLTYLPKALVWHPGQVDDPIALRTLGHAYGVLSEIDPDKRAAKELIVYGLKGLAAYLWHARALGFGDTALLGRMHRHLAKTLPFGTPVETLLETALQVGHDCVTGMALLDQANTETYGHPQATEVTTALSNGPAILITGHDLHDLKQLLEQTQGLGIRIYTHGEMLPAHGYPKLKAYPHLAGHFGTAWHNQTKEFTQFSGPVVFTTNCLVPPRDSYKGRLLPPGKSAFQISPTFQPMPRARKTLPRSLKRHWRPPPWKHAPDTP